MKRIMTTAFAVIIMSSLLFSGCSSKRNNDFNYTVLEDGTLKITATNNMLGKDIRIPESIDGIAVTSFDAELFTGLEIDSLYIPKTITSFNLPNKLDVSAIHVDAENQICKSISGVLYSKDGSILYKYPSQKTETEYRLPEEVKEFSSFAFNECDYLERVVINNNVETIPSFTFVECSNLNEVALSTSVGELCNCFIVDCPSLTKLFIPKNVNLIQQDTFSASSINELIISEHNEYYSFCDGFLYKLFSENNSNTSNKYSDSWEYIIIS